MDVNCSVNKKTADQDRRSFVAMVSGLRLLPENHHNRDDDSPVDERETWDELA